MAAVLAAFICAAPFLWSLVTAFKQNRDLYNPENNPFFFNRPPPPTTSCTCCATPPS